MRVFVSWAKDTSRVVADALKDWLPDVIQSLEPWVSSADVGAGARWSAEIAQALSEARIGIICVTAENQREPWLLFEAGALAKTLKDTFVCPYLIQMDPSDLSPGPLTQFQAKRADKEGTLDLVATINGALGSDGLTPERLRRLFDKSWPELDAKLSTLQPTSAAAKRDSSEIMTEILETVRSLARRIPEPRPEQSPEAKARQERSMKEYLVRRRLFDNRRPDPTLDARMRARIGQMSDIELEELLVAVRGLRSHEASREVVEGLIAALLGAPSSEGVVPTTVRVDAQRDGGSVAV